MPTSAKPVAGNIEAKQRLKASLWGQPMGQALAGNTEEVCFILFMDKHMSVQVKQ